MTARAAMLTTSVTANRTRPAAISALTSRPEDSGKSSAMFAAIVDGFAELIRLNVTSPETDSTIATAIVSPSARPRPSIDALIMADRPNGRTVMRIISQRVAPSASARLLQPARGLSEHRARDGGDDRQDHHGEHEAGDEHRAAGRGGRALEERDPADVVPEPPLDAHGGAGRGRRRPRGRR